MSTEQGEVCICFKWKQMHAGRGGNKKKSGDAGFAFKEALGLSSPHQLLCTSPFPKMSRVSSPPASFFTHRLCFSCVHPRDIQSRGGWYRNLLRPLYICALLDSITVVYTKDASRSGETSASFTSMSAACLKHQEWCQSIQLNSTHNCFVPAAGRSKTRCWLNINCSQ